MAKLPKSQSDLELECNGQQQEVVCTSEKFKRNPLRSLSLLTESENGN